MKHGRFAIDINGRETELVALMREGGDDLMFFIHGLGCSKDSFHHFWNQPGFAGFSVLAADLAGFGESAKPNRFSYAMEAQAHVCALILERLTYKNLHIVAHSMGGAVALLLIEKIRPRVKSFANIEGNLIGADCGIISRRIVSGGPVVFASEIFPELKAEFKRLGDRCTAFDTTSSEVLYKSAESLVAWSDSGRLLEIFLALPCRKAYFFGDANAENHVLEFLPDDLKWKIKQSGHFPMNDNPADFYDALLEFIDSLHEESDTGI